MAPSAVDAHHVGAVARDDVWLAVAYSSDGFEGAAVVGDVGELWSRYEESAGRIAVDVPIGLSDTSAPRPNERLASRLLGRGGTSVVPAPVREATHKQRYRAATRVHERKTGGRLPTAAFERADRVAAVDQLLGAIDDARPVFREAHPEVCYLSFADEPPAHDPATAAGYAERMRALASFDRNAPPTVQSVAEATAGHEVSIPAVLDAVALALTVRPGPGELRSLPADPPTDATGLPQRFVYRRETPLEVGAEAE